MTTKAHISYIYACENLGNAKAALRAAQSNLVAVREIGQPDAYACERIARCEAAVARCEREILTAVSAPVVVRTRFVARGR